MKGDKRLMKRKKYIIILVCFVIVFSLMGGNLFKHKKGDDLENCSTEEKAREKDNQKEKIVETETRTEIEKMSLESFGEKQEEKIEVAETKQFVAEEPKEEYTLSKGNAQDNTIVHKDLTDLEDSYLYNVNTYSVSASDLESEGLYGYNSYADNENAQLYYQAIDSAMRTFVNENSDVTKQGEYYLLSILAYNEYGITQKEAVNIYYIYKHDHPLYYWLSATVILYDNGIGILTDEEYATAQIRNEYDEQIQQCIDGFVSCTANMNQDEKVRYVHDTIIKNTNYAYEEDGITPQDANWAHNIIGYISNQGVVCEGYAKMFQVVLKELGIETIFVTGTSQGEKHAWNMVRMSDEKWYWMDLTWDDEPDWNADGVSDVYFCCPKSLFSDTHTENTVSGTDGSYLYDLPKASDTYTYYCASADNILSASEPADIIDEVVDKTKVEINKENNCVIFKVDDAVKTLFLNTLFSGYQKVDNEVIYYYQMFMDAFPDTVGKVSDIQYRLIGDNYYVYFQPQDSVIPVVKLTKNKKEIGNYTTLAEAFSAMTDNTADYQMTLINGMEALIFPMKTSIPDVGSVSITGCKVPAGSSYAVTSFFLPEDLYIGHDLRVEDLHIGGMLFNDDTIVKVGAADFTVSGDYFSMGTFSLSTALGLSKNSISLQGDEGSNFVVDGATVELNVPASFSKVTLKNGKLNIRGSEYNFETLETYGTYPNNYLSFANVNSSILVNIGDILAAGTTIFSVDGSNTININGDIYGNDLHFGISHGYGSSKVNLNGNLYGQCMLGYSMYNIEWKDYESLFSESYMSAPNVSIEDITLYFSNTVAEFNKDEYRLQKNKDGAIFVEKFDNTTHESGNYVYRKLSDGTCELLNEINNNGLLTIPAEIDGYPVSKIADNALYTNKNFVCEQSNQYYMVEEGVLYSKDKKILYRYSDSNEGETYTINRGTEVIKERAFYYHGTIKEIIIPASVQTIEKSFVYACDALESISVEENNSFYSSKDGVLFDKSIETLLLYPANKADICYETPDTVITLQKDSINSLNNAVCFKINENCKYIYDGTFTNAKKLQQLHLPDELRYITFTFRNGTIYASSYRLAYEYAMAEGLPFVLTTGEFAPPSDLSVQTNLSMVQLEWARSNFADSYQIYRKEKGIDVYELLNTVSDLSYLDISVVAGKEYQYYVVSVRNDQEEAVYSEPSEIVTVVATDKGILDNEGYDMQGIAYLLDKENKTAQVGLVGTKNTSKYQGFRDGKVIIPSSVESGGVEYQVVKIGDYAFYENHKLKEIIIPDTVIAIGVKAFWNSGLSGDVEISQYVEEIGTAAFAVTSGVDNIFVSEENTKYASDDGILYSKDKKTLICYPEGRSFNTGKNTYIVPDFVTEIGDYAFYSILYSKVYLPDTIEIIGDYAFAVSSITDITLANVTKIGISAFNGCKELQYVNLGDKLEIMSDCCFLGCKVLKGIYIPDSVKKIGGEVLSECSSLEYVVGCKNAEFEKEALFSSCYNLKLIMMPEQIKTVPNFLISDCSSLEKLYLPETITELSPYSLTRANNLLVLYGKTGSAVEEYANSKSLKFENVDSHEHSLEWVLLDEKTDVGRGLSVHKCSICNYVAEVSTTQVTGHNWSEWQITKEVCCEEDGYRKRVCEECGDVQEQVIEKRGHKYGEPEFEWIMQNYCLAKFNCKNPECDKQVESECRVNIQEYEGTDTVHTRIVSTAKIYKEKEYTSTHEEIIHVAGRAVKENVIDSTCTTDGSYDQVTYCSICQLEMNRIKRVESATGHTWSTDSAVTKEPTCTEKGTCEYKCMAEGCTATKGGEIPALGHDMSEEWTTDTETTCIREGEKSHHCTREECGYREDITTIAKAEHAWSTEYTVTKEPTCIEKGECEYKCIAEGCTATKDGEIPAKGHDMSDEWITDKESTCTSEGEKSHHCRRKGCEYREDIAATEKAEHSWSAEYTITKEPTCTEKGIREYKCMAEGCIEVKEEEIAALGHEVSEEWTTDKEATCTREGEKSHHCKREGCEYREDITAIEKTEHKWSEEYTVTKEPTCTEKGACEYRCMTEGCKEVKEGEIAALGHDLSEEWTTDKESTCTSEGEKSHHCKREGCEYREDITTTEKTEHKWSDGWIDAKPVTCTEKGTLTRFCLEDGCEATKEEDIPALGHDLSEEWITDKEATCTSEGEKSHHCKREGCEYRTDITSVEKAEHTWSTEYTVTKESTCTEMGMHKYKCVAEGCIATKEEEIAALGHDISEEWTTDKEATCIGEGEKSHHCKREGCAYRGDITATEKAEHIWRTENTITKEPTCTEKGMREYKCMTEGCTEVKEEEIAALGHDLSEGWTTDKEATCIGEGEKSHHCKREGCAYRGNITATEKAEHIWRTENTITKESTCTEKGMREYKCITEGCTEVKEEEIAALGHDLSEEWTTDKEATCIGEGEKSHYCMRAGCDYREDITVIEMAGHIWNSEYTVDRYPTETQEGTKSIHCKVCDVIKKGSSIVIPKLKNDKPDNNTTENLTKEDLTSEATTEKATEATTERATEATTERATEATTEKATETTQEAESNEELPTAGTQKTVSTGTYKVTESSAKKKEVVFVKPKSSKKTTVTIPATVNINGQTYKVTEVASKALKNNKKINSVIIGKNITKIGKEAFSGCKNLKTITIKSTTLKSVDKNAIKNINKNATIKVPKKQYEKYKKMFSSQTGYKKSMKIKK